MFPFEDLPSELRLIVLEHIFEDARPAPFASDDDNNFSRRQQQQSYRVRLQRTSSSTPDLILSLNLNPHFRTLFTSKPFLTEALPIFARVSVPKFTKLHRFHPSTPPSNSSKPTNQTIIHKTIIEILKRIPTFSANTEITELILRNLDLLSHHLPCARRLELHDTTSGRLHHRRMRVGNATREFFSSSAGERDDLVSETLTALQISDMIQSRVLPCSIEPLCRHMSVSSRWPEEMHRLTRITFRTGTQDSLADKSGGWSGDVTVVSLNMRGGNGVYDMLTIAQTVRIDLRAREGDILKICCRDHVA